MEPKPSHLRLLRFSIFIGNSRGSDSWEPFKPSKHPKRRGFVLLGHTGRVKLHDLRSWRNGPAGLWQCRAHTFLNFNSWRVFLDTLSSQHKCMAYTKGVLCRNVDVVLQPTLDTRLALLIASLWSVESYVHAGDLTAYRSKPIEIDFLKGLPGFVAVATWAHDFSQRRWSRLVQALQNPSAQEHVSLWPLRGEDEGPRRATRKSRHQRQLAGDKRPLFFPGRHDSDIGNTCLENHTFVF